ncbi:MAG: hypothetical protein J6Y93_07160, partial [Treponema sp.]|nr:hypothetical protein [Treponema sp.]
NNIQQLQMRRIGLVMNILMGVTLSCALSLTGLALSGHFEVKAWLISFGASTVLSLIIGICLPVRKASLAICSKCGLKERTFSFHCLDSLVSDIFYTPLITFLMVLLAYNGAKNTELKFMPMFLHSLLVSMIAGYVLIFILQPLYLKILLPKNPAGE